MYKKSNQLNTEVKLNNQGAERIIKTNLTDFDGFNPNVRFFSLVEVKPGEEVFYHEHSGESEIYYILSGTGVYNDNGTEVEVVPGMVTFTPSGEGHSIKNTGDENLSFIALILAD